MQNKKTKCDQCNNLHDKTIKYYTCYSVSNLCKTCYEVITYMEGVDHSKMQAYKQAFNQ